MQVLQYEEIAGTWSEIGKMEKAQVDHGVVEIDVNRFCSGIIGQTNKSKMLSLLSSPSLLSNTTSSFYLQVILYQSRFIAC